MAELRKCKECGKMFLPKGREQYCPDVHYRPCPICGTPVVAKYLSDPPKRCDNCRGRKAATPKPAASSPSKLFKFVDDQFKFAPKPKETEAPQEVKPEVAPQAASSVPQQHDGLFKTDDIIFEIPETIDRKDFCKELTGSVRRYIGPVIKNGFIPGHDYELSVKHELNTYGVGSDLDVTDHKEVKIFLHYTSQISINQNFARLKEAETA